MKVLFGLGCAESWEGRSALGRSAGKGLTQRHREPEPGGGQAGVAGGMAERPAHGRRVRTREACSGRAGIIRREVGVRFEELQVRRGGGRQGRLDPTWSRGAGAVAGPGGAHALALRGSPRAREALGVDSRTQQRRESCSPGVTGHAIT